MQPTPSTANWLIPKGLLLITLTLSPQLARAAPAGYPPVPLATRTLDCSGNLSYQQKAPPLDPGVLLELQGRWLRASPFYLGGVLFGGVGADDDDVERIDVYGLLGLGLVGGIFLDLREVATLYAGGRLDLVEALDRARAFDSAGPHERHWPDGWRAGAQLGVTVWLFQLWGHPFGLELRLDWMHHRFGASQGSRLELAGGATGVLF